MNIDALRYFVEHIADSRAKNLISDSTACVGLIKESLHGYYKVQLMEGFVEGLVTALPLVSGQESYKKDDAVYLFKTQNTAGSSLQDAYYILGSTASVEDEYFNLSVWNVFEPIINKNGEEISYLYKEIKSFEQGKEKIFTIEKTERDSEFLSYIMANKLFSLSACFSCQSSSLSNYGLQIDMTFVTRGTGIEKNISYLWTAKDFEGRVFHLNEVHQKTLIDLQTLGLKFDEAVLTSLTMSFVKEGELIEEQGDLLEVKEILIQPGSFKRDYTSDFSLKINFKNNSPKYFIANGNDQTHLSETITFVASAYYGASQSSEGQLMDTSLLDYYWAIKDETVTEESLDFSSLFGEGWRILNPCTNEKKVFQNNSFITNKYYQSKSNEFQIEENNKYINRYENSLKCVATYQGFDFASEELYFYNYNYYDFEVNLNIINETNRENPSRLELSSDRIKLIGSETIKDNPNLETLEIKQYHLWIVEAGGREFYVNKNKSLTEIKHGDNEFSIARENAFTGKEIYIQYEENDHLPIDISSTTCYYYIFKDKDNLEKGQDIKWKYKVFFEKQNDNNASMVFSAEKEQSIRSLLYVGEEGVEEEEIYFCWALELPSTQFTENLDLVPSWESSMLTWEKWDEKTEQLAQNEQGINYYNRFEYPPKDLRGHVYKYVTRRTNLVSKTGPAQEGVILAGGAWSYPIIEAHGKNYGIFTPESSAYIEELNTFNKLTNGGEQNALEWTEDNKLFINATMIQTGILQVPGSEPNSRPKLKASMYNHEVEIAGWQVSEDGLYRESTITHYTTSTNENGEEEYKEEEYNIEYGLNSDTQRTLPSLVDYTLVYENGVPSLTPKESMVIFYCKKKVSEIEGENQEEVPYPYTFALLEDGSLYATAANFSGENVVLGNEVKLGEMDVSTYLRRASLPPGSNVGDAPDKPISSNFIFITLYSPDEDRYPTSIEGGIWEVPQEGAWLAHKRSDNSYDDATNSADTRLLLKGNTATLSGLFLYYYNIVVIYISSEIISQAIPSYCILTQLDLQFSGPVDKNCGRGCDIWASDTEGPGGSTDDMQLVFSGDNMSTDQNNTMSFVFTSPYQYKGDNLTFIFKYHIDQWSSGDPIYGYIGLHWDDALPI